MCLPIVRAVRRRSPPLLVDSLLLAHRSLSLSEILTKFPPTKEAYLTICYASCIALFDTLKEYPSTGYAIRTANLPQAIYRLSDNSDRVAVKGDKPFPPHTQPGWDQSTLGHGDIDIEDESPNSTTSHAIDGLCMRSFLGRRCQLTLLSFCTGGNLSRLHLHSWKEC